MKNSIETVGIVGFGAMGQFMAERMFEGCEVVAHDPNIEDTVVKGTKMVGPEEIVRQDALVLATPAASLEQALIKIDKEDPGSNEPLLVDICSVKLYPTSIFYRFLPNHGQVLLSHPLFGPESARHTLQGHRLFVTEAYGDKAHELVNRWHRLGTNIVEMSADEHDRHMAKIQALPFIFGRIANSLQLDDPLSFQTPSRLAVRKLSWLDELQSDELFQTVVAFNPYARSMLNRIMEAICTIKDSELHKEGLEIVKESAHFLAEAAEPHELEIARILAASHD